MEVSIQFLYQLIGRQTVENAAMNEQVISLKGELLDILKELNKLKEEKQEMGQSVEVENAR
jgi:hypothetical protein